MFFPTVCVNAVGSLLEELVAVNPLPTDGNIRYLTYVNERFVGLGNQGVVVSSTDGENWTRHSSVHPVLAKIVYANGIYLATATSEEILYKSVDLESWTPTGPEYLSLDTDIYSHENQIVMTGRSDKPYSNSYNLGVYSSNDGISWHRETIYGFGVSAGVIFGEDKYIVLSEGMKILSSPDGTNWEEETPSFDFDIGGRTPLSLHYESSTFVITGMGSMLATSVDGINWTGIDYPEPGRYLEDMYYDGEYFYFPEFSGTIRKTADFVNWTSIATGESANLTLMEGALGSYVCVGKDRVFIQSSDLVSWTNQRSGLEGDFDQVCHGDNTFVAFDTSQGTVITSDGGYEWEYTYSGTPHAWKTLAYFNGSFIVISADGYFIKSADGVFWSDPAYVFGAATQLERIVVEGNFCYLTGSNGLIRKSIDFENWIDFDVGTADSIVGLTSGGEMLLALQSNGRTWLGDGSTAFEAGGAAPNGYYTEVVFANGIFLATGSAGQLARSADGISWVNDIKPNTAPLLGTGNIATSNEAFFMIKYNGINVSSDAYTWSLDYHPYLMGDVRDFSIGDEAIVVVGSNGLLMACETPEKLQLKVSVEGPGSVEWSPKLESYWPGQPVSLVANSEDPDYYFHRWEGPFQIHDIVDILTTMNSDKYITAHFHRSEQVGNLEVSLPSYTVPFYEKIINASEVNPRQFSGQTFDNTYIDIKGAVSFNYNNDGMDDLLIGIYDRSEFSGFEIQTPDAEGNFITQYEYQFLISSEDYMAATSNVVLADIDGDGIEEICLYQKDIIHVFWKTWVDGEPDLIHEEYPKTVGPYKGDFRIFAWDIDDDGKDEIFELATFNSQELFIFEFIGNAFVDKKPGMRNTTKNYANWHQVFVADLEGDSHPEILMAGGDRPSMLYWTGSFYKFYYFYEYEDPYQNSRGSVVVGDFDPRPGMEVAMFHSNNSEGATNIPDSVEISYMDNHTLIPIKRIGVISYDHVFYGNVLQAADVDSNGLTDIIIQSSNNYGTSVLFQVPKSGIVAETIGGAKGSYLMDGDNTVIGDFNGDGQVDYIYIPDGGSSFLSLSSYAVYSPPGIKLTNGNQHLTVDELHQAVFYSLDMEVWEPLEPVQGIYLVPKPDPAVFFIAE